MGRPSRPRLPQKQVAPTFVARANLGNRRVDGMQGSCQGCVKAGEGGRRFAISVVGGQGVCGLGGARAGLLPAVPSFLCRWD